MLTTSFFTRRQIVGLLLMALALIVCLTLYVGRGKTYPLPATDTVYIENSGVLHDWMPASTYQAAVGHVEYYLATQNVAGKVVSIVGAPSANDGGELLFSFNTNLDSTQHAVLVDTVSYGSGVSSSAVYVDEDQSTYAVAKTLYNTSFYNFDVLTSSGLSGAQVYEIQSLLLKSLKAGNYSLNTDSVRQVTINKKISTTFDFTADGRTYHLKDTATGVSGVDITVTDGSGKQVFHASEDLE